MIGRQHTQAHLRTFAVNTANETQHATVVTCLLPTRRSGASSCSEAATASSSGNAASASGTSESTCTCEASSASCAARQDQQLAAHVLAGQVQARIRSV
jgi:hypothetical protein